jgi:hypothetical protein
MRRSRSANVDSSTALVVVAFGLLPTLLGHAHVTPEPTSGSAIGSTLWGVFIGVAAVAAAWVALLAHELGHALAALVLTPARIEVHFPTVRARDRFALGRLDFVFDPGSAPHVRFPVRPPPLRIVLCALAGPAASLVAGVAGVLIAKGNIDGSAIVFWGGAVLAFDGALGAANLVPFQSKWFPGTEEGGLSDGLVVLRALSRRERSKAAAERPGTAPPSAPRAVTPEFDAMLAYAIDLARRGGEGCIRTAHVFAALAAVPSAAQALLANHGVRGTVAEERLVVTGTPTPPEMPLPMTTALHQGLRRAEWLQQTAGDPVLRPEHVLAALLRDEHGDLTELLALLSVEQEPLRHAALEAVSRR